MNTTLSIIAPNGTEWNVGIEGIVDAGILRSYMKGDGFVPAQIGWDKSCPAQPDGWHRIRQIRPYDGDAVLAGWPASKVLAAFKVAYDECWGKPDPDRPSELQYQIFLLQHLLSPLSLLEDLAMALHNSGLSEVSDKINKATLPVEKLTKAIRDLLDSRTSLQCRARYWGEVDSDER